MSDLAKVTYRKKPLSSADMTPVGMQNICDFFRWIFSNPPYNQFAFHLSNPRESLSYEDLSKRKVEHKNQFISLKDLDNFELQTGFVRWMKPGEFESRFKPKLKDAYIAILENAATGDLVGLAIGRVATIEELFLTEEIQNPVYYSGMNPIDHLLSEREFFGTIQKRFDTTKRTKVFFTVGYGVHPSLQGSSAFHDLLACLAGSIRPEHMSIPALAEIPPHGPGRVFGIMTHDEVGENILANNHDVIWAHRLETVVHHYMQGRTYLSRLMKRAVIADQRERA